MKPQVSFKFDGEHNKQPIIDLLNQRLVEMEYTIKKSGKNVYEMLVASKGTVEETFLECVKIQTDAVRCCLD